MTKKAFTLVELLVVVGIMATMATMSIGGYFAIARGMADRGAISTATSLISLAQERSRIDLVPTAVYFYNEVIQTEDRNKGTEFVAAGVAIAVRCSGRISRVTGDLLGDEFADLDLTYGLAEDSGPSKSDTFRLYRFNTRKMEYSSVYSEVVEDVVGNEAYLVEKPADRNFRKANGDSEDPNELIVYSFRKAGDGNANWNVGDAYGYEFARIRLPDNYIFGSPSDVPSEKELVKVVNKVIECKPESNGTSLPPIDISARRPSGWTSIGDTKDEMKDI
ncbi:MAG: type II secretion system protein [Lentisphaerae bacterium]|nr:type II secretion system protein [Lentisphaerota bacterium]